jgi:putative lipoprotein
LAQTGPEPDRSGVRVACVTKGFWARQALSWLSAAAALLLSTRLVHADPTDPWWGRDKALHFGVAAGIATTGYALSSLVWSRPSERALAGAALALSAGVGKELWDLSGHGTASWKDLTWDALGTAAGVGVALSFDVFLFDGNRDSKAARTARLRVHF